MMSMTSLTRRAYSAVQSAPLSSLACPTTTLRAHVPAPFGHGSLIP